jgi:methyl coenzyme M reductase gamma subunit
MSVRIYHILRDGSRPTDITGHVVKLEDATPLYRYLRDLTYERNKRGIHNEKNTIDDRNNNRVAIGTR